MLSYLASLTLLLVTIYLPMIRTTVQPMSLDGDYALQVGALRRDYHLHLPPTYTGTQALPLVIVLHGSYGTGTGVAWLTNFSAAADRNEFVAVYPNAINGMWNTMVTPTAVDDVAFISALIDHLQQTYAIDTRRVYVTGVSNGGVMVQRLGCELASKLAAIAPVAGAMEVSEAPSCAPASPISVLAIHGTSDWIIPFGGIARRFVADPAMVRQWAMTEKCQAAAQLALPSVATLPDVAADSTEIQVEGYAACPNDTEVQLYTVFNGGHTWPGGYQYLPEWIIGKTSHNMVATDVIWTFFARHAKP